MTSRELRRQRREAERKARKLEYRQSRAAGIPLLAPCAAATLDGEPESSLCAGPVSTEQPAVSMPGPAPQLAVPQSAKSGPTGPRTSTGKAISSANSLKHGLASGRLIIPGEDPAEFEALLSDLVKEHAPANATESLLVQQMAQSWWLMQRAIQIQNQAFTETRADEPAVFSEAKTLEIDTQKLALFLRYQTTYERAFHKALNALMKQKLSRAREQAVSSRRKSDAEFVSQRAGAIPDKREFVSQDSLTAAPARPSYGESSALATAKPPVFIAGY